jgi:hypothetical protein
MRQRQPTDASHWIAEYLQVLSFLQLRATATTEERDLLVLRAEVSRIERRLDYWRAIEGVKAP